MLLSKRHTALHTSGAGLLLAEGKRQPSAEAESEAEMAVKRTAPEIDIKAALQRLPRPALEQVIFESISAASAVTLELLEKHAPGGTLTARKKGPAAEVKCGPARTGTGCFDLITEEVHVAIFSKLALNDRLTLSTAVCKSWRAFRQREALWRQLEFGGAPYFFDHPDPGGRASHGRHVTLPICCHIPD